ncbi:AAA domain-containing protein [Micromonospora sp. M71_S20]|nr:AAA domain-containing protein [Micromonospora sp. M71_S20]
MAGLLAADKTRRGEPKPSLMAELVDGWRRLAAHYGGHKVLVHLVTPGALSRRDRPLAAALKAVGGTTLSAPIRQDTAAFVESVLRPLTAGARLQEVDAAWKPVVEWIREQVGMKEGEVEPFLAALRIDADTAAAMPMRPDRLPREQRTEDIGHLAAALHRRVQDSEAGQAVVLTSEDVAALAGFGSRGRARHLHRFPIDLDRYTPLLGAEQELAAALESAPNGYLCVLGPPGSGKSTLLAHATPGLADRVVTYLAFLPGDAAAAGRVSATDFLHDVVVQLEASQLKVRKSLPERDVNELRLRFRDLLSAASAEFTQTGRRTLLIIDGLDHVARARVSQPLLDELPAPEAVPAGVVIVLGSQTLAPLNPKIQHHLSGSLENGTKRTVDLTGHRLTAAAVEDVCRRLVEAAPALALTTRQITRVVQLVGGHPLALAYVTNALIDLVDERTAVDEPDADGSTKIPADAVDDALDRCVRYSGSVADDYAAYLAELPDSEVLQALLGDLARLRSPINIRWVQKWADAAAVRSLVRLKHLFRILDRHSWMFFHDSFRQFVLEATSVDLLGEPDPDADARRHAFLADECALAQEGSRESGEEFFHAAQAGQQRRALALAAPDRLRARFLAGTSPAVLTEDIRTAMRLAAEETDGVALVGLMLVHAELQSREQALESVDLTGMLISAGDLSGALAYALPDATLRIPVQQALSAAVKLDERGHLGGRMLFDAAEIHELGPAGGNEQWEMLSAWARGMVRFRPLSVLHTALRRMSERALSRLTTTTESPREHAVFALGGHAVYFTRCAVSELIRTGRISDAEGLTATLRAGVSTLLAATPEEDSSEGTWGRELIEAAYTAVADAILQTARARAKAGQWEDALKTVQNLTAAATSESDVEQRALAAMAWRFGGEAAWVALQIAAKATSPARTSRASEPAASAPTDAANAQRMAALATAAFAFGVEQLQRLDAPTSIASGDLSGTGNQSDVLGAALRVRTSHLIVAGLSARSAGQWVTEDLLVAATPVPRQPPANQPAGAQIDPEAAAHRDRAAISHAAQLDKAVTNLAVLYAAVILGDLPTAALRGLASRALASRPTIPDRLSIRTNARAAHITFLQMLIDVAAGGSAELLSYVGEKIGELGRASSPLSQPAGAAPDRTFSARQLQRLGLHILQRGVRVPWLDDAITDADAELQQTPGAYERLDLLVTQAAAHLQAGDTATGRALLARVMPESFSPHWRKDVQLEIWVQWLVRATQNRPDVLLAEAADIAPLIAALTEATDGSAEAAAALLLQAVARVAPRHAVRLAAWQLREGSLPLTAAHEALAAGIAANILNAVTHYPDEIEVHHAATLLSAVVAAVLAPLCPTAPGDVIQAIGSLVPQLPPWAAATITEQLTRAVDVHVLASARRDWRRALHLPSTPTSRRDEADEEAHQRRSRTTGRTSSRDWGVSEYGLFKHANGSTFTPDAAREAISDLDAALSWRSLQAEAGTFSWLPILQPLIAHADRQQLDQLVHAFDGAYDEAAILAATAERLRDIGACGSASAIARIALDKTEPGWWDAHYRRGVRRQAWQTLTTCEGQSARKEAMRDLAQVLTSADYWPGNLMLQLDDILPVIAPDLPAIAVWNQVRQSLNVMRTGVVESQPPLLDGPVHAAWWAPQSPPDPTTATTQVLDPPRPHIDQGHALRPNTAGQALIELLLLDLDHPTWAVREAACAAMAWVLEQTNPLADHAAKLTAALLASQDHQPVLVPAMAAAPSDDSTSPPASASDELSESTGIGGDAVREMAARALASAAIRTKRQELLIACVPAQRTRSWLVTDSLRRAFRIDLIETSVRPLPAGYRLTLPRSAQIREPDVEMGPYSERIREVAHHADLDAETLLHRLSWLAEQAQRHIPDDLSLQQAAKGTSISGMLVPAWAQAIRAAYGRIISELVAAKQVRPDAPELAAALELVDIDLVPQPFTATPPWIPIPIVRDWVPAEQWLSETNDRLAQYEAGLAGIHATVPPAEATNSITLTSSLLEPLATVDIGPLAAVIGADHEFVVNDEGNPTERYLLSTTFDYERPSPTLPTGIIPPPRPAPTIRMIKGRDMLLADGVRPSLNTSTTHFRIWAGKPLLVWTTSLSLHTNAATWLCLNPDVANAHQWQPHSSHPLCWQDAHGAIMAATLLWRRSSTEIRHGLHETAGRGSVVVLTDAGLTALTNTAPIRSTHQVTRSAQRSEYDGPPGVGHQSAIAALTANWRERSRSGRQ